MKLVSSIKYSIFMALILFISACDKVQQETTQISNAYLANTLTRILYIEKFQLDPIFATSTKETAPLRDLLTGLMVFNDKGEVVKGIAQDWKTEDGKTWIFSLKEDARWSNNAPVSAQDFVSSWQRLANSQSHSPLADYLIYMGIKNAEAVISNQKFVTDLGVMAIDQYTLKIELNRVNFQLPLMLAHSVLLPTYQGKAPILEQVFISNGAYQLQKVEHNKLTLKALDSEIPFQNIIYYRLNNGQTLKHYDLIDNPSIDFTQNILKLPKLCTYFYEFNFNDPLMKNKKIRQAIKEMVSVNKVVEDNGMPNSSILPNSMYLSEITNWKGVIVEDLLADENITVQNPLKITLTFDNQSVHQKIADNLLRSLSRSDLFQVKQNSVTWQDLLTLRETKQFQMIRSGWCTDFPDPIQFLLPFHSKSPDNKISYNNQKVDLLLEQIENSDLTSTERQNLMEQVLQQLEQDIVILSLFQYQQKIALDPTIKGVNITNSSGVIYSKDLYRDLPVSKEKATQ